MNNPIKRRAAAALAAAALPVSLVVLAPSAGANEQGTFGPGCSALPSEGPGSPQEMANDPVATAASTNPELSTLTAALQEADLVDTLNEAEDITVFAPTDDAFDKIPAADLDAILADKAQLTDILTYHVVEEPVEKSELADGSFTTLEGGTLTTQGSGNTYEVNDTAKIVCGGVATSNATVHIIDTVLMPK
ncbi:beta-Ig-H3/fasciclin [Streptomyces sp. CC53]|uniref:fasciclin domain-containing protein n=1 Tax=unclassified Streptomyces TaxID=2593676 RepID=UPI0008DDA391|nr:MULTISPECIES: fasciclin domain-containing protein [unclassified Streptomyces]OII59719.1 beta-Ig-H3/fasciclin [Streptomyces sp. CC53]OII67328.1 beta-Ig-H3/fasciclin [Streptomyces sp. CC77]